MTMTLIQTVTLTTLQADIVLSSIPQNFTDLLIISSLRTDATVGRINDVGLTGITGDVFRRLEGNGSATSSATGSNYSLGGVATTSLSTANTFANSTAYIPNYAGTTLKTVSSDAVTENNATESHQRISASLINSTSPITSLTLSSGTGNDYLAGSTVSLYGITEGFDGIVKFG
jgi:hypothetical protein